MVVATLCIFCPSPLNAQTKPEHILLNALGGRQTSRQLVCSACNGDFGNGIDAEVAGQVAAFRNHLQLPSGDGKLPPKLRRLQAGDETIDISGDGRPELVAAPFEIVEQTSEGATVQFNVGSMDELRRYLPHVAKKLGTSVEALLEGIDVRRAVRTQRRPGTIHFALGFGGELFLRSLTKSCLELWATVVGNEEVRGPPYDAARRFVTEGGDFVTSGTELDERRFEAEADLAEAFGPLFNLIYVTSDAAGRVLAHFTLYNLMAWRIELAQEGGPRGRTAVLISDPLDPRRWSKALPAGTEPGFEWLLTPTCDESLETPLQRVRKALGLAHDRAMDRELRKIVEEEYGSYLTDTPTVLPDELHARISRRVAERVAALVVNVAHEEPIALEQILAAARGEG